MGGQKITIGLKGLNKKVSRDVGLNWRPFHLNISTQPFALYFICLVCWFTVLLSLATISY